jgi:hypothetical protein
MSAKTKKTSASALRKIESERKKSLTWFEETAAHYVRQARKYPGSTGLNLLVTTNGIKDPGAHTNQGVPPGGGGSGPHYNVIVVKLESSVLQRA